MMDSGGIINLYNETKWDDWFGMMDSAGIINLYNEAQWDN